MKDFDGIQQNVHLGGNEGMQAPAEYLERCGTSFGTPNSEDEGYCALMIMMDEAIGHTVCSLEETGIADNMFMVVASDNGGLTSQFPGVNWPQRGGKGSYLQGGLHNAAFVYASTNLIPVARQGSIYNGLVHISDWFPTFLHLASGGSWTTPTNGQEIDGMNIFSELATGSQSPRNEVFHNYDASREKGAIQIGDVKLIVGGLSRAQEAVVGFHLEGAYPETCFVGADPVGTPTLRPTAPPQEVLKSTLTCDELGWINAAARGDSMVCSSSVGAEGLCSGVVTWVEADIFCRDVGGRLCTLDELLNDETRATGCSADDGLVWSSTLCGESSFWVAMGSTVNNGTSCFQTTIEGHAARCCADVAMTSMSPSPLQVPTTPPSLVPTSGPTPAPAPVPTSSPLLVLSSVPTSAPTPVPSPVPTSPPSPLSTLLPSPAPSLLFPGPSIQPSSVDVLVTSPVPFPDPTALPSSEPTLIPNPLPSRPPNPLPTRSPTPKLTLLPSSFPNSVPTTATVPLPTTASSVQPSSVVNVLVTNPVPVPAPTAFPTSEPTFLPRVNYVESQSPVPTPRSPRLRQAAGIKNTKTDKIIAASLGGIFISLGTCLTVAWYKSRRLISP